MTGVRDGVATAWLDRPDRGNALSAEATGALMASVSAALADPAVHTLVLRGRGRHFCTGFDLSALETETDATLRARFVALERLLQAVWHAPVRTVAFATGRAWGAGADLFASCDIRACAPDATFRFPGSAFGIVLGTRRLVELIGWDRARALVTEGAMHDAAAAKAATLVTDIVDGDPEAFLADTLRAACRRPAHVRHDPRGDAARPPRRGHGHARRVRQRAGTRPAHRPLPEEPAEMTGRRRGLRRDGERPGCGSA